MVEITICSIMFSIWEEAGRETVLSSPHFFSLGFYVQREIICALSNMCPVKGNNPFFWNEEQIKEEEEGCKVVRIT